MHRDAVYMQAATLARGRSVRQSKLLFYGKLAEKALQTYERDGWGEFPTQIVVERREIRPTADRGPILLCVDTSGKFSFMQAASVGVVMSCQVVWTALDEFELIPCRHLSRCTSIAWLLFRYLQMPLCYVYRCCLSHV